MSVANKEEAVRCITIAKRCISEGNTEKAHKFLTKSLALHPLDEAKELLESLKRHPPPSSSSTTPNGGTTRKRANVNNTEGSSVVTKECTPEMQEAVNKVKGKKDYYTTLGCSKDATDADLKKAYRKLALALHPDKNWAPGAVEAFKAVGNAYAILSNKEKRDRYDRYGNDDDMQTSRHRSHYSRNRNANYYDEDEISPEELFNMFFGGMQPGQRRRGGFYTTTTQRENTGEQNNASIMSSLLQMSPLILLILMSMLNSIFVEDPVYSFHRNGNYKIERITNWNNIKYFVKSDFTDTYTAQKVLYFEYDIEREYKTDLQMKCVNNSRRKEQLLYQYRVTGNRRYLEYAEAMDLAPCQDYKNFKLPRYIDG